MKQTLQVRQSQQLTLTPQLRQSIRLLQLSNAELRQEIDQALDRNPLLERIDDPWANHVSLEADSSLRYPHPAPLAEYAWPLPPGDPEHPADWQTAPPQGPDSLPAGQAERYPAQDPDDTGEGHWGFETGAASGRRDDFDDSGHSDGPALVRSESLHEHLLEQLASTPCEQRQRNLVHMLIDELADDGYLRTSLEELHSACPPELEISLDELASALQTLQDFDPSGVGARSPSECIGLQLKARAEAQPSPSRPLTLALAIVEQDLLPLLASRELERLCRILRCNMSEIEATLALIRSLDPKPGNRFSAEPPHYVTPDILVHKSSQGWRAMLNPAVLPRLKVNDAYAHLLKAEAPAPASLPAPAVPPAGQPPVEDSLARQLQEAQWMVKNLQQRSDTILRISQAIVDRQQAYFNHGAVAMRPLVLREIAETVGLHESTVSRVTTQKYMATPFGTVVELKYFFGSHVATDSGGVVSATAIRAHLKQLIQEEDPTHPLSDNQLTEQLAQQGFVLARRTVAKYRESLGIAPAAQRRSRT